ncbi:hypothetical protein AB7C87_17065 [Natrarchaeobius sp. A-rgal3]|uniref:hypothetical protein n=1 Tax=Natrarchaeobius versutus TaxID=1679078 RepID=UPI00350EC9B7
MDLTFSGRQRDRTTGTRERSDDLLPENIDEMLGRMERGHEIRAAEQRGRQRVIDEQIEAGRRQEPGREPTTVSRPEGRTVSRPDTRTVSREPATDQSGPVAGQTRPRSQADSDLSPRETQLAAQLGRETPDVDARGVETVRQQTPETDLRTAMDGSATGFGPGAAMAGSAGLVAGERGRLEQAQRQDLEGDDLEPGQWEDTAVAPTDRDRDLHDDVMYGPAVAGIESNLSEMLGAAPIDHEAIDPAEDVAVGPDVGVGVETGVQPVQDVSADMAVDQMQDIGQAQQDQMPPAMPDPGLIGPGSPPPGEGGGPAPDTPVPPGTPPPDGGSRRPPRVPRFEFEDDEDEWYPDEPADPGFGEWLNPMWGPAEIAGYDDRGAEPVDDNPVDRLSELLGGPR